jgi:hypothetical protein
MGERLAPSPDLTRKPREKRKKREIADLGHIKPDSLALEELNEVFSSLHIRKIRGPHGKIQWEIISFINQKGEKPRQIRKSKEGAIRHALDRAKKGHTQILVKDEGGNVVEKIQLKENEKPKKKGANGKH